MDEIKVEHCQTFYLSYSGKQRCQGTRDLIGGNDCRELVLSSRPYVRIVI